MRLSREQRWIFANQYLILEHLHPDQADYYARAREVLESGYELNYGWIAEHIFEQTMTEEQCSEVINILDMFTALERSYDELAEKPNVEEQDIRFHGFDGNHETDQMSYARFLIEKEHKFSSLADAGSLGDNLNSHMPVLDTYRRMLAMWQQLPLAQRYQLAADDIARIVAARPYSPA
jgi:uncharacterized protein